jgi:hypothetical protein
MFNYLQNWQFDFANVFTSVVSCCKSTTKKRHCFKNQHDFEANSLKIINFASAESTFYHFLYGN